MLVSFTVENWRSFRDATSFSMIASRERQHDERLSRISKYRMKLLPIAAIYGGNASGKTNMVSALTFARSLVLQTSKMDKPLAVQPFMLDVESAESPTRFEFERLVDEILYEYSFVFTSEAIVAEKLVRITSASEHLMFSRVAGSLQLGHSLVSDERLKFVFAGTDDNQLFVNNAMSQKLDTFIPVTDWFHSLCVIDTKTHFNTNRIYLKDGNPLVESINTMLGQLDTGITQLDSQAMRPDDTGLSNDFRSLLEAELREGEMSHIFSSDDKPSIIATRNANSLSYYKQVAHHTTSSGSDVRFDIDDESDGSRRLIDLIPEFLSLAEPESNKVFVIDEIDRSLHTILIRRLLEWYLETRSESDRSQLIFTTHDVLLMDQSIFRRDEMWVTERDADGSTTLFALSDYKDIRYDKDIRKSYLQGRLGGVPRILLDVKLPAIAK
jgi:AAA15 family ATPase/GTPase